MLIKDIMNFLFPPSCYICGNRLSGDDRIVCFECLSKVEQTDYHLFQHNILERMFWGHIPIEKAAALMRYDSDTARYIVMANKYLSHPEVGYRMAYVFAVPVVKSGFFNGVDVIIPVPISWRRRLRRQYNQSEYIARAVSDMTGIPMRCDVVKKVKHNPTQTRLSHQDRMENAQGVYRLVKPEAVRGKHVLLVDDVITTGSTILSCAKEICKAGGVTFSILALAHATGKISPEYPDEGVDSSAFGLPLVDK